MMPALHYQQNELYLDDIALLDISKQYGTPCYVYSLHTMKMQLSRLQSAFEPISHRIFYAVKANNNLAILNQFAQLGIGFDVVSGGELKRVLAAGAKANTVIFSGVGKTKEELCDAILNDIHCINIESIQELMLLTELAIHFQKRINIALRINPNVDAKTHPAISTGLAENKFGLREDELAAIMPLLQSPGINCIGIACHIGSQITTIEPFKIAARRMASIVERLKNHHIDLLHIDLGGGFGIAYDDNPGLDIHACANAMATILSPLNLELYLEPGRFLIGPAACLLTKVLYTNVHHDHAFAILDAGMNDFMRPALYDAHHQIYPIQLSTATKTKYHMVGPVCESTDCFAKAYPITPLAAEDCVAIDSVGAYGSSMSSRYNARPLIPEILVIGNQHHLIRQRETVDETYRNEIILDV